MPLSLVADLEAVDGVAAALPDAQGPLVLVGADGTAVQSTQAPSFGFAYDPRDRAVDVVGGRRPESADEIAVESATLRASGLQIGDATSVVIGGEVRPVTVVGEIGLGSALAGATVVFLDAATAQAAFAPDGTVATISVLADDGLTEQQLVDRIAPVVAASSTPAEAVTGDRVREQATENILSILGFITTFLLVFAGISLFVGGFIIANTFSMWVRQRTRELALLRAVGASPLQVFSSIVLQAAIVGVVGAVLGVAGGLGLVVVLRQVLGAVGMQLTGRVPLDGFTLAVSVLVGTLVSVLAAALPARRAALVPPVEALRDEVALPERSLSRRAVAGAGTALLGVAALVTALLNPTADDADVLLGCGAGAVVLGVLAASPVLARGFLRAVSVPVARWRPVGPLARGNVTRNPRRTANTAGALMIGMALVGAAAVIAATTQASTSAIVAREATTDYILRGPAQGTVPAQAVADVRALPGVRAADTFATASVLVDGTPLAVTGIDPTAVGRSIRTQEVSRLVRRGAHRGRGRRAADHHGRRGLVARAGAGAGGGAGDADGDDRRGHRLTGVRRPARGRAGGARRPGAAGRAARDHRVRHRGRRDRRRGAAGGAHRRRPAVRRGVGDGQRGVRVGPRRAGRPGAGHPLRAAGAVDRHRRARHREHARPVRHRAHPRDRAAARGRAGPAPAGRRRSRWSRVLTAVFGTTVGLVLGVALAATLPTVFADVGLRTLAIPWASLALMLALAVVVGVVAALWPAIRAARLPVLDAVSTE